MYAYSLFSLVYGGSGGSGGGGGENRLLEYRRILVHSAESIIR